MHRQGVDTMGMRTGVEVNLLSNQGLPWIDHQMDVERSAKSSGVRRSVGHWEVDGPRAWQLCWPREILLV